MPVPDRQQPPVPIELVCDAHGRTLALAWRPGEYALKTANQETRMLDVPELPEPLKITGPWTVNFDPKCGGPGTVTMESLTDWTQHAEPAVKYYSGTATYRKQFDLPPLLANYRLYLDLGEVYDVAAIRVNSRDVGTLWKAPWQVELTHAIRPGRNVLEIDVVNPWNNRLVGDANLPPEERHTFLTAPTVKQDAPLLPAGLLGPVTVSAAQHIELN
jgi:hypothetical protein